MASSTPSALASPQLTGHFASTLSEETIQKCRDAESEKARMSFWGQVGDFFPGAHKEAAQRALFRLADPKTMDEQVAAFAELLRYVAREDMHRLHWHISSHEVIGFQVGDAVFAPAHDVVDYMKHSTWMDFEDSCHLLLSLRLDGHHVLTGGADFGLLLHDLTDAPQCAVMVGRCQRQLSAMPTLLDALQIMRLHRDDEIPGLSARVRAAINALMIEIDGTVAPASGEIGRNAERLCKLATALKDRY
ncbi:hypothetical protein [Pandoraea oxalativorans]|uniref:Uncharacterized protein n=1 Tax=Pandoraea oxalativorans TaxID=573737 RepID=A0A0E3YDZ3_9BURK|nr:hypothetical protein [Pandoraea oxalativorans]AKC71590.2 hypothetical protein MB84_22195 [Pandoraea oxalativorans]